MRSQHIDRIQGEKKQLELQAINNRDYAKKIEQRFFMGTKGQCNVDLGKRVKELERSAGEKDAAFESQRRELQDAQEKFNILKRALETRFEELQLNGSLHTGILFELTRLQDQSTSLALQLSDERKANKALEAKFLNLQAKETDLEETLVVREVMIGNQERERAALEEKLAQLWNEKQTFAFEKSTLLKFIQEQAEVKFQLDAQIKQIQDSKMAELAALRQKLELSVEDKQKLHDSLRETSFRCENLQHECQTLRNALQDEQQTKIELEAREQELQLRIQRLNDDLSKKEDDFAAARDVCRELQTTLEGVEQDSANLRAQIEELEAVEVDLRQQLAQKLAEELALRAAMENSLHDLETLSRQRNEVAKAMNEAVTISASSLDEQQALESKLETQRKQLEQLKNSKNLLQNAMLEQLSALRKQLQLERIQRIDAEAKLKQLLANGFGSTSQRSNALKQQKHRNSPHENSVPPSRRPEATDK
uniref:Uncharacterized protein n=1 Tax=Globisporangium ultimum (strain ATCC 200006 / CBS 805.95 / DAOM BR144) TaxID=431595 RepID=K3WAV7_GLOUD